MFFWSWLKPAPKDAGRFEVIPSGAGPMWTWRHVAANGAVTMQSRTEFYSPLQAQRDIRAVRTRAEARVVVSGIPAIVSRPAGGP